MSEPDDLTHYMQATARMRERAEKAEADRDRLRAEVADEKSWREAAETAARHATERAELAEAAAAAMRLALRTHYNAEVATDAGAALLARLEKAERGEAESAKAVDRCLVVNEQTRARLKAAQDALRLALDWIDNDDGERSRVEISERLAAVLADGGGDR